jgi:hypothetical protein
MIDARFKCNWCRTEWGGSSDQSDERQVANFLRKVRICRKCNRAGEIIKCEERKTKMEPRKQ